jgi:anaerobic magnesium-protoporphyrin IX monomethyl ester cyclase
MKVLFLHPPWPGSGFGLRSQNRWPRKRGDKTNRYPILLCYTATLLQSKGYDVKYIDSVIQDYDLDKTFEEVGKFKPDVVFIETSTPTYDYDVAFVSKLKEKFSVKVLMAGTHVTKFAKKCIEESKVDVVIKGEQDYTTLKVVDSLKDLKNVNSICYRDGDKVVDNVGHNMVENLDELPFPDRNLIPHEWYVEGHARKLPFTFVMGARGCPNQCSFCLWPHVYYNHRVRVRSAKNIVDELEWLVKEYGMKEVFFDEGTFNISKKRVMEVCNEIINRGVKIVWSCSGRVDCADIEMFRTMKKAGCKLICYGVESANQRTLDKTKKAISVGQTRRAVKLTKDAGIIAHVNLMVGFPWETKNEMENTIDFGLKLDADTVQYSLVFPHPGSEMFDQAIKEGWFYPEALEDYSMFDMTSGPVLKTEVSREELMDIVSKAHAKFFLRPNYIIKQLLKIRNYDDFKYTFRGAKSILKGKILFKKENE